MKRFLLLAGAVLLVGLGAAWAMQNAQENSDKSKEAAGDYKISAGDAARVNPVKSSAEGLAEARKVFGYDCDMCHGAKGDGKGEVVESMKLTMHDWRDPATLANMTDGEIFYIITKGKGRGKIRGGGCESIACVQSAPACYAFPEHVLAREAPMAHAPQFLKLVQDAKKRVKETNVPDVKRRMDAGERFLLIDVREDNEWAKGHVPNAVHLGKGIIERDIEQRVPDTGAKLILYCGGGFRSALVADNLQKMGYTNVESMDGGWKGWVDAGLPTAKD